MRGIEQKLTDVSSAQNQWQALTQHERLQAQGLPDAFEVSRGGRVSSTGLGNRLPMIVGGLTDRGVNHHRGTEEAD